MPTWETANDWDSLTNENNVVHEDVSNTNHTDAGTIKRGYSIANPYLSGDLIAYWPLQEGGGGTAYDFAGSNNGNVSGASVGNFDLLGTDCYWFDGSNDYIETSYYPGGSIRTLTAWFNFDSTGSSQRIGCHDTNNRRLYFGENSGSWSFAYGTNFVNTGSGPNSNSWYFLALTFDGSTCRGYINGSQVDSFSASWGGGASDDPFVIGSRTYRGNLTEEPVDGGNVDVRAYNSRLSSSQIQAIYDIATSGGTFTTNWGTV